MICPCCGESIEPVRKARHRLAVGDCTDPDVVASVMRGEKARCMWADPPYGVEYVGGTKDALIMENDEIEGLPALLCGAFLCASGVMSAGATFYIAGPPGRQSHDFSTAILATSDWLWHETLVWVKDSLVLGHSDYHYQHELVFYGWKGSGRKWYAGRDQTTVFKVPRPRRSSEHPTMKPVELVETQLRNSTRSDDVVYDPFLGSGTTMVAAHRLHRRCFGIEISPAYCAVVLERMSEMGLGARLME